MSFAVPGQVINATKGKAAQLASVGSTTRVDLGVSGQFFFALEGFTAETLEG